MLHMMALTRSGFSCGREHLLALAAEHSKRNAVCNIYWGHDILHHIEYLNISAILYRLDIAIRDN